jgi:cellulose synthase/poly-beta-1,6-N-acetylglucosamine synthase-like glycosyltransferase
MVNILNFLQWILFLLTLCGTIYLVVFAVAGLFYRPVKFSTSEKFRKFVVFIPGYKEDNVIVDVARKALDQDYPKEYYDVIVIADGFKKETIEKLKELPIIVNEVIFKKSSKAKSLNKTMEDLSDDYEVALVLDADNVMAIDFISKMNQAYNNGFIAIQGHRLAKNSNTHFAVLDALSEEINNNIFRRGHRKLGLSAALIGSGMAFNYQIYKTLMSQIESFGEDKELEHKLLKRNIKIEYLDNALVYDEKTTKSQVFVTQRTRWIANQLNYATNYLGEGFKELLKGNIDFFDKIVQHLIPPRIFIVGLLSIILFISLIFNHINWSYAWLIQWFMCVLALFISVPKQLFTFKTLNALFYLPLGFFLMLISLTKINKARKGFAHTTHTFNESDNHNL